MKFWGNPEKFRGNSGEIQGKLLNPMKIKYIQNNMIFCKLNLNQRLEEKVYNNIDMNIFNISNQNIIFFNHGF